jgi:Protein of unknown function (DUF2808)
MRVALQTLISQTVMPKPISAQMLSRQRRLWPALFLTGCLCAVAAPIAVHAQTNPGFTFNWGSGPSGKQQLSYVLDYGTPGFNGDRYRLKLGPQKVAISSITITYPDYYDGTFDPKAIEVRVGAEGSKGGGFLNFKRDLGKPVTLSEASLDPDNRIITLTPSEVIPAGTPVQIVLSNVRNPATGGMYYFNARINSPGDIPLSRYIGTWVLGIYRS